MADAVSFAQCQRIDGFADHSQTGQEMNVVFARVHCGAKGRQSPALESS
jgi:hypothetical protein